MYANLFYVILEHLSIADSLQYWLHAYTHTAVAKKEKGGGKVKKTEMEGWEMGKVKDG